MHTMFKRIIRLQLVELVARLSSCIQRLYTMAHKVNKVAFDEGIPVEVVMLIVMAEHSTVCVILFILLVISQIGAAVAQSV